MYITIQQTLAEVLRRTMPATLAFSLVDEAIQNLILGSPKLLVRLINVISGTTFNSQTTEVPTSKIIADEPTLASNLSFQLLFSIENISYVFEMHINEIGQKYLDIESHNTTEIALGMAEIKIPFVILIELEENQKISNSIKGSIQLTERYSLSTEIQIPNLNLCKITIDSLEERNMGLLLPLTLVKYRALT